MPNYPYICPVGHREDVIKPMRDYASLEVCSQCGQVMDKEWGAMVPAVQAFEGHFNPSLGCYIGSKAQQNDACSRIEEKTGSRPIPIGDYKPPHKPHLKEYKIERGMFDG